MGTQTRDWTTPRTYKESLDHEYGATQLAPGTWVVLTYSGYLTKQEIRQFFIDTLGIELPDDRISLRPRKFVISVDRMQLAYLIEWLLSGWDKNPSNIKVANSDSLRR